MNFKYSLLERLIRIFVPETPPNHVEALLDKLLKKCPNIRKLKGTQISSAPKSQVKGNALFINGIYRPFSANDNPDGILESYRTDARIVARGLAGESFKTNFLETCISFYELPEKGNIRVYRTYISNKNIDNMGVIDRELIANEFSFHPRLIDRYKDKLKHQETDRMEPS